MCFLFPISESLILYSPALPVFDDGLKCRELFKAGRIIDFT
ncbi:MAG: hypothetical protein ACOC4C_01975 [Fibrobacterota bacterium]